MGDREEERRAEVKCFDGLMTSVSKGGRGKGDSWD